VHVPLDLSIPEILVVLLVAVLVFGGKLPDAARKFGSAISEFKRGMREELRKVEQGVRSDEPPADWRPPPDPNQQAAAAQDVPPATRPGP
jgi:sec-independent protein translocase protein TatA